MPAFIPADAVGILDSPEEVLSTLHADGSRRWLYPTPSTGRFWRRRMLVGWGLIAFFVALPIVKIGGRPAVLLDVALTGAFLNARRDREPAAGDRATGDGEQAS